jgi:hypothetical protein
MLVHLVGSAHLVDQVLRLTDDAPVPPGAVWTHNKQRLGGGFETTFDFRIGVTDGVGADGLAFVVQDFAPDALGQGGGCLGYCGLPRSLAVEVDGFQNFENGDQSENAIAVHTLGVAPNSETAIAELGTVTPSIDMSDGQVHTLRIRYAPGTLSVFLDGGINPVLAVTVNLTSIGGASILDQSGRAWVGFTAAVGGFWESHDLVTWAFTPLRGNSQLTLKP